MPSARVRLLALQMVFALNALGLSAWFPRIPDVKEALGLDVLTLAFCLFAMPVGTMAGFLVVPRIIRAIGTRATARWGGSAFLLAFIGPALAPDAVDARPRAPPLRADDRHDRGVDERQGEPDRAGARAADHDPVPRLLELRHRASAR